MGLKNLSPGQFFGSPNSRRYHWILKLLLQLKNQRSAWLFYYFDLEKNYDVLKSKGPCILVNENMNLNKTKRNWKWKIPHTVLESRTLCFSSYKSRKLKIKLWWTGARERKKRAFFVPFILSEGNFFNIYVLSQCSVLNTFSEDTYFYISKTSTSYTFWLVFKIVESLPFILKNLSSCM